MIDFIKNLNFEKLKEKMKPLGIAAVCFVAVFIAGFGAGRASGGGTSSGETTKRSLSNYNTNTGDKAKSDSLGGASSGGNKNANTGSKSSGTTATKATTTPVDPANCHIKGSKSKTYHVPGGSFYERTNPAACFNSEEEAQAAGYKKSSR